MPVPTLAEYRPTVRNRIAAALMGDSKPGDLRHDFVENLVGPSVGTGSSLADWVVPAFGLDEMIRDVATPGQRVNGAVGLGLMAVPVPGAVKKVVKGEAKAAAREAAALLSEMMPAQLKKATAAYERPSVAAVYTQAGQKGERLASEVPFYAAHPEGYAKVRSKVPPERVQADRVATANMAPRRTISPEALEGSMVIPLNGDKSIAGQSLTAVNGVPLADAVELYGGPRYMDHQAAMGGRGVWASGKGVVKTLNNRIAEGLNDGLDVYGVYSAMGPTSADQTTMMADALLAQMPGAKVTKRNARAFDEAMQGLVPDWAGIMSPQAAEQLRNASGGTRKQFAELMDAARWRDAGFPDVGSTRVAITEPDLLHAPIGSAGYTIGKFDPAEVFKHEPDVPHPTYPAQMRGDVVGGFEEMVPRDLLFPDFYAARRAAGAPVNADARAFDMVKPAQVMTPEVVDRLMGYLEAVRLGRTAR